MGHDNTEILHFHFNECPSTQAILREKQEDFSKAPILISTQTQNQGVGRKNKQWKQATQALAMSFTLKPCDILSLTSLEVGVLTALFFKDHPIKLKWPNDLMLNHKKIGGILCQNVHNTILVGLGLNLYQDPKALLSIQHSHFQAGALSHTPIHFDSEKLSKDLYLFILKNRLSSAEVREIWLEKCDHLNKMTELIDETQHFSGIFSGIGNNGEAIIETKNFVSGSLKY